MVVFIYSILLCFFLGPKPGHFPPKNPAPEPFDQAFSPAVHGMGVPHTASGRWVSLVNSFIVLSDFKRNLSYTSSIINHRH